MYGPRGLRTTENVLDRGFVGPNKHPRFTAVACFDLTSHATGTNHSRVVDRLVLLERSAILEEADLAAAALTANTGTKGLHAASHPGGMGPIPVSWPCRLKSSEVPRVVGLGRATAAEGNGKNQQIVPQCNAPEGEASSSENKRITTVSIVGKNVVSGAAC
jgi:hypothetical protein